VHVSSSTVTDGGACSSDLQITETRGVHDRVKSDRRRRCFSGPCRWIQSKVRQSRKNSAATHFPFFAYLYPRGRGQRQNCRVKLIPSQIPSSARGERCRTRTTDYPGIPAHLNFSASCRIPIEQKKRKRAWRASFVVASGGKRGW